MNTATSIRCAACDSATDADGHCSLCIPPAPGSGTDVNVPGVFDLMRELQAGIGVTNGAEFLDMTMREYAQALAREGECARHGRHRAKSCQICVRLSRCGQ